MPLLRYSETDVRKLFSRLIPIRWPREALLFVTGCRAEQTLRRNERPNEGERGGRRYHDRHDRPGFLGATPSRLIYLDRTTPASVIMGVAVALAALAIGILLLGNDLMGWFVLGSVAVAVWIVGRIVEAVTAANVDLEFDQVVRLESGTQRLIAVSRHQSVLSLHIDDPSDFRMVAALVSGLGNAPA